MDVEVIRSLGINTCKYCISKSQDRCTCHIEECPPPDPKVVHRFIECGRLLGNDSFYSREFNGQYYSCTIIQVSVYA